MKSNPALPCPECGTLIPFEIRSMLKGDPLKCEKCGTELKLDEVRR